MSIDVSGHPLLSAGAAALDTLTLEAHTRVAEQALGLAGATFTGDDLLAAADAVALQVSFQVDTLPDRDWGTLTREEGLQWVEGAVNPIAARMAGRLIGTARKRPTAKVKVPESKPLQVGPADCRTNIAPYEFDVT